MDFVFNNETPIYLQLASQLRMDIISGKLKCGERLLSVRDIAFSFKVNPNTVQKALAELEREKLIYTERTNGKYVTLDEKKIGKLREKIIDEKVTSFFNDMQNIGISSEEIKKYIQERNRK